MAIGVSARQTKIGLNRATSASWSTVAIATAVGANDGHYVRDDIGNALVQSHVPEDHVNQNFYGAVQGATVDAIQAVIPMHLHYNDVWMNVLWALVFGTGGTAPTQLSTSIAYTNTFEPATTRGGAGYA